MTSTDSPPSCEPKVRVREKRAQSPSAIDDDSAATLTSVGTKSSSVTVTVARGRCASGIAPLTNSSTESVTDPSGSNRSSSSRSTHRRSLAALNRSDSSLPRPDAFVSARKEPSCST